MPAAVMQNSDTAVSVVLWIVLLRSVSGVRLNSVGTDRVPVAWSPFSVVRPATHVLGNAPTARP